MMGQIRNAQLKIMKFVRLGFFDNLDTAVRIAASVIENADEDAEMTPELREALAVWGEVVDG